MAAGKEFCLKSLPCFLYLRTANPTQNSPHPIYDGDRYPGWTGVSHNQERIKNLRTMHILSLQYPDDLLITSGKSPQACLSRTDIFARCQTIRATPTIAWLKPPPFAV